MCQFRQEVKVRFGSDSHLSAEIRKKISGKPLERPGIARQSERGESLSILRDPKSAFERATVFRSQRFRSLRGGLNAFGRPKSNSNSLTLSRPPQEKSGTKFFSSMPSHIMGSILFVRIC
jgi:hypothetical protein